MTSIVRGRTLEVQPLARATRSGCWMWIGPRNTRDDAMLGLKGRYYRADEIIFATFHLAEPDCADPRLLCDSTRRPGSPGCGRCHVDCERGLSARIWRKSNRGSDDIGVVVRDADRPDNQRAHPGGRVVTHDRGCGKDNNHSLRCVEREVAPVPRRVHLRALESCIQDIGAVGKIANNDRAADEGP